MICSIKTCHYTFLCACQAVSFPREQRKALILNPRQSELSEKRRTKIVYELYLWWVLVLGVDAWTPLQRWRIFGFLRILRCYSFLSWFFRECMNTFILGPLQAICGPKFTTDRNSVISENLAKWEMLVEIQGASAAKGSFWLTETHVSCMKGDSESSILLSYSV